ncbi:glycosyl hydrolase [Paenibacillus sp. FSL R5-0912]|uniref:glycosyl hydrolase n=1 Tax=Paenibacillus sp. FSL R5-0912 TaxID=1536771 RepID=UPI0004F813FE|nr:glycosyl hydrolase [Paenibacillus sp. FSL R5-0912]AIQ40096.1 hypothetical protein R50912_08660 [Paenibacillus sp. FSL R5-0912]
MSKLWEKLPRPPAEYRSAPLWSWNDKLEPAELERQIEEMHAAGIGGFFMHARGGLQTPYMGEAWMEAIRLSIVKSRELGMNAWFYDENGWPSGFADGEVPAKGIAYQQKMLAWEKPPFRYPVERAIACYSLEAASGEYRLLPPEDRGTADLAMYYEVNPYYTDTLSKLAVGEFITAAYERYWEAFGQFEAEGAALPGIFTDEPQFARGRLPWSFELEEAFASQSGYAVQEILPALFFPQSSSNKARYDYWSTVTAMFTEAYAKQIGDFCAAKGWAATGHVVDEQELMHQVTSVGDPMAFYEYLQIPGCDWLGRFVGEEPLVPKQVSSAARQTGKKRTITESFGCSGWNVSFQDLKRIGEWQFVHGINFLCQHLQGYSLRGLRKRDYPPSLFYQQPWWKDYRGFNDYFARLAMILAEGTGRAEVLLLHPVRSAWLAQCGENTSAIVPYHEAFARLTRWLCQELIEHDYGSESIIARHGRVSEGRFIVGEAAYRTVIIPPSLTLDRVTVALLEEFVEQGGHLVACGSAPALVSGEDSMQLEWLLQHAVQPEWNSEALCSAVTAVSAPFVQITGEAGRKLASDTLNIRSVNLEDSVVYYIVNSGTEGCGNVNIELRQRGRVSLIDPETGSITELDSEASAQGMRVALPLYAVHSLLLKVEEYGDADEARETAESMGAAESREVAENREAAVVLELGPEWIVAAADLNSLTLDTARMRLDGGEWSAQQPVIFIQEQLLAYGRAAAVELQFRFQADSSLLEVQELYLALEQPEDMELMLNGQPLSSADCGWWRDISFRTLPIAGKVVAGENILQLSTRFSPSGELLAKLEKAKQFEAEGNNLTIDQEFESIYIVGAFGVESAAPYTYGERRAVFTEGPFKLTRLPESVTTGDLVQQGFPFFAGILTLEQNVRINEGTALPASWSFYSPPDTIVSRLFINGTEVRRFLWEPYTAGISGLLHAGENRIRLELTGSCRNLLGPHHHIKGEVYKVGPDSFKDKPGWTDKDLEPDTHVYQDRYGFVRFGLSSAPVLRG